MIFAVFFPDYWVLITIVSLLAAVLCYGLTLAYFQKEFSIIAEIDYTNDLYTSCIVAFITFIFPFVVLAVFIVTEGMKHGLKFK